MIVRVRPQGRGVIVAAALAASVCLVACNEDSVERRARQAQEKILSSIPNRMAIALDQKVTPEEVKQAQQALTSLKEYMGEIDGKLDPVTINAIQAFQRAHGLDDDGILDGKTKELLAAESKV